jgi:transketolase
MGGVVNGMVLHGGWKAASGTFLVFSDYMRPAIRLAALMRIPSIFGFTHDSIMLGEDGPTHQPIEQLASLRAIPDLTLLRPADAIETAMAWTYALRNDDGPVCLVLTRQGVPDLERRRDWDPEEVLRGGYVVADADGGAPDLALVASGSEVHLALAARGLLGEAGVRARVVSMPSMELYLARSREYRDAVLPPRVPRVSIELGSTLGWRRIVGDGGLALGIDRFGASAPGDVVAKELGFTPEAVSRAILEWRSA